MMPWEEAAAASPVMPWDEAKAASPIADVLKSIPTGLARGAVGLATAPFDLGAAAGRFAVNTAGHALDPNFVEGEALPSATRAANTVLDKGTGGALGYDAKTVPGQYAQTISEFAPAALNPTRTLANLVRYAAIPGAISETAGQLTKGSDAEPAARAVTGILSGGAAAALERPSSALQIIRSAAPKLSEQDAATAADLMTRANQAGAPITVSEAVQHATGGATKLGDLMRVVEGSQKGGAVTAPFFAQRPQANAAAASRTFDQIAPASTNPTEIAPRIQSAAKEQIQGLEAARSSAVEPYYTAASTQKVPDQNILDIIARIDEAAGKDKTGILAGPLQHAKSLLVESPGTPAIPGQRVALERPNGVIYSHTPATPSTPPKPVTDIENLDRARKYLRDKINLPDFAAEATPKEAAGSVSDILSALKDSMAKASPDFAQGLQTYKDITESTVNPAIRSPTGQLASSETLPQQTSVLFSPKPLADSAQQIGRTMADLVQREPSAANDITRNHLSQQFSEANQNTVGGPNQFGGAKFAAQVAGNPQQNKNLAAVLRALPSGANKAEAVQNLLDTFSAQGTRQRPGSQTAFNEELQSTIGGQGGAVSKGAEMATQPMRLLHAFGDAFQRYRYGKNTSAMAKMLIDQNPETIKAIASQADPSALARILRSGMMPSLSQGFQ